MIEGALVLVIMTLCGLLGWLDWNNRKERAKLVNAIMSKNASDLASLDFVDKQPAPKDVSQTPPDLVPFEGLDEEEFDKHIQEQLGG